MFMCNSLIFRQIILFWVAAILLGLASTSHAAVSDAYSKEVKSCLQAGWKHLSVKVGGLQRAVLWKRPRGKWKQGAIVVLHGGGGSHHQFCSGEKNLEAQVDFAEDAIKEGFAVFLLDSTNDRVTDRKGRQCGKRFDFSVLERKNIDLPFIGKVVKNIIPQLRPGRSSKAIFLTGFSTGGFMAMRAATHFNNKVTAFAPVAAGDPYGTRTLCNVNLSGRKVAKGVLIDLETNKSLTTKAACRSKAFPNEKSWPKSRGSSKPAFKQFHNKNDTIIDFSCMEKAKILLEQHGYKNHGKYMIDTSKHSWEYEYNDEIIEFFKNK